eukprot:12227338-Alexandrium_andersonii.AAC.1
MFVRTCACASACSRVCVSSLVGVYSYVGIFACSVRSALGWQSEEQGSKYMGPGIDENKQASMPTGRGTILGTNEESSWGT